MPYLLLTGVTGLLGRYLVKDLLLADVPLAVLVRPTRKATARQRVETLMAYWDEFLDRRMPRPVVLAGDITEPELGLDAASGRWIAENCDRILHNAASLQFVSTGPNSEPWCSNVEGTRNVLELCKQAGIREFHHVSTAYVAGLRSGVVYESELDVGQQWSNDYEQSKVQAEKLVRSADFLDTVTVFRPAIITGDATNGYTTTFHGYYAPLQVIHTFQQTLPYDPATRRLGTPSRFSLLGNETKNLVPVDWVSAVTAHIISHREHHGKTYHLTPRHAVTFRLLADILERTGRFYAVKFNGNEPLLNPTEYEKLFCDLIRVYSSYWRDDPRFDTTNTDFAAPHLPCPHIDRNLLLMLADFAQKVNFNGPPLKPQIPDFDAATLLQPWLNVVEQRVDAAHPNNGKENHESVVGLDIIGPGGGQWRLYVNNGGAVTGAEPGVGNNGSPTLRIDIEALSGLVRGNLTVSQAVAAGGLQVTRGSLPADSIQRLVRQLTPANDSAPVVGSNRVLAAK